MTPDERDQHDQFLRLFVENEEALRGFVRSLVPFSSVTKPAGTKP